MKDRKTSVVRPYNETVSRRGRTDAAITFNENCRTISSWRGAALAATAVMVLGLGVSPAVAAPPIVPLLPDLTGIVVNKGAAIALGKALFFDEQVGSDGNACASCHFSAGADSRLTNQLSPGLKDLTIGPDGDTLFGSDRSDTGEVMAGEMASGAKAKPNYTLVPEDMPLHKLKDPLDRNSDVVTTTNDRVSSAGSFDNQFKGIARKGNPDDRCNDVSADVFYVTLTHQGGHYGYDKRHHYGKYDKHHRYGKKKGGKRLPGRQVEPRNTPTTINAVFFQRNFWDVRANSLYNGVGVFGMRDIKANPTLRLIVPGKHGYPKPSYLEVENGSLASQAMAPPLSGLEMSCEGRVFPLVGRKMLHRKPLALQKVHHHDSVLGYFADRHKGLKVSYRELIRKAFDPKYWKMKGRYRVIEKHGKPRVIKTRKGFTQMEQNFSMFWGISIMMYEQTLVSDQSPFDLSEDIGGAGDCATSSLANGPDGALWAEGCRIFVTGANFDPENPNANTFSDRGGNCSICHGNPPGAPRGQGFAMLSEATQAKDQPVPFFLQVPKNVPPTSEGTSAPFHRHDAGVQSIGIRPPFTDLLAGGTDDYGNPLSWGWQYQHFLDANGTITLGMYGGVALPTPFTDNLDKYIHDPVLSASIVDFVKTDTSNNNCGGGFPPPPCVRYDSSVPPLFGFFLGPPGEPAKGGFGIGGNGLALGMDGASKSPVMRNVALTAPYFSWGGYPTLRQALKFYNRGGNARDIDPSDPEHEAAPAGVACKKGSNMGTGPAGTDSYDETTGLPSPAKLASGAVEDCDTNQTETVPQEGLGLMDCEEMDCKGLDGVDGQPASKDNDQIAALVVFLKSLTDPRVQCNAAPFDGPEQHILNGHKAKDEDEDGLADDIVSVIPASGKYGFKKHSKLCLPNAGDMFAMQGRLKHNTHGDPHWYGYRKGHERGSHHHRNK